MISRRKLIKYGAAATAGLALAARTTPERALAISDGSPFMVPPSARLAAQSPQIPLAAGKIPQFVDALPSLEIVGATGQVELQMTEFKTNVLPAAAVPGYTGTWVWSYLRPGQTVRDSYLGPVIVATRGQPTEMKFVNNLGSAATTNVLAYKYGTDQTLHWADPLNSEANMWNHMAMPPAPGSEGSKNYGESPLSSVPAVVHLHGGEVPPVLDGGPDAWFTSDGVHKGHAFYSKDGAAATNYSIYRYPNSQEGAPIWFHDHTLGATRLNVYAGLAGGYLILDPANDPKNLPEGPIPLVIQDRMFDTTGQLFFPSDSAGGVLWTPNPEHPYWVPEFVGDVICVNGKAWPFLNVEPRRYTFLFLNGSNARTYEMYLVNQVTGTMGPPLWVIGTDGGYLDRPVKIDPLAARGGLQRLPIMPGERYLAIIDFSGFAGQTLLLRNSAKVPYPAGAPASGNTTARIMQFRVGPGPAADTSFNPATPGVTLRGAAGQGPPIVRLVNPATGTLAVTPQKTRQLTLNEVMGMPQNATNPVTGLMTKYPGGPLEILVNNTKWSGKRITGVDKTAPAMPMYIMQPIPGFTPDNPDSAADPHHVNYLSELPNEGETEVWEFVNLTADAHPMHTHLTQFQILNRQNFDVKGYTAAYALAFPGGGYDPMTGQPYPAGVYIPAFGPPLNYNTGNPRALGGNPDIVPFLKGAAQPPMPYEAGWKDTIMALPGMVTRIAVRFAPTDLPANTPVANASFPFDPAAAGHGYVWHCHIVDHEDNEMMRPDKVIANSAAVRSYTIGVDY